MAGLAWSAPVSCVALLMRGTHAARTRTECEGAHGTLFGVLLCCRRHQHCLCKKRRFRYVSALFGQLSGKPLLACI